MINRRKTFQEDFYRLLSLLRSEVPFAFNRFSDGELFILQNKELILADGVTKVGNMLVENSYRKEDHKHFDPTRHSFYRDRLIESFRYAAPNYFKGLTCPCCSGEKDFQWQIDFHGGKDANFTWANLLVNSNYPRFLNEMLPLFNKYKVVFVCNKKANITSLPFVVKDFRVGYNAMIEDYNLINHIKSWINDEKISGYLFLFSASTFSKIAIHQLYSCFNNNTYIDVGTTLNPFIGMSTDRGYLEGFWSGKAGTDLLKTCVWGTDS